MTDVVATEEAAKLRKRHRKPWIDDIDASLSSQVAAEVALMFRPPFEVVSVVVINVSLALGVWFFINPAIVLNHTALIFLPIALASWAFADVPSTNLFGGRSEQVKDFVYKPAQIRRIMTVENIGLWLLIAPACMILSLALLPSQHEPLISIAMSIATLAIPFAYLGIAAIVAPLLPFHPLPWRERLRRRDTWLRYGTAITVAYLALTWPAAIIATGPATLILGFVGKTPTHYLVAAILLTPWCLLIWRVGLHLATYLAERRSKWLMDFLSDPNRG